MAASHTQPPGGPETGHGELTPDERAAFKQRADALGRKLEQVKAHDSVGSPQPKVSPSDAAANGAAMGKALRVSTELIGGVVVGSGLGYLLDRWLGTWPLLFIVFFLLGSAAGMVNVVRAGTAMKSGPINPKAGPSVRDDDET